MSACSDETSVFQIVDCGLLRQDLTGTWCIGFETPPATANLVDCNVSSSGAGSVTVDSIPFEFPNIDVFPAGDNVGFQFEDSAGLLFGNVEADSCLMLLSFLDDEDVYLNCFGTFDIPSGTMLGGCDSASVPEFPLSDPLIILDDCDLNPFLGVVLTIAPCN